MAKKPDIVSKSVSTTPVRPIVKIPDKEKRNGGKGKKKTFPRPTNKEAVANSETTPTWKLSPLLGGRCLDLDPVFSKDEKHLLVAQALSLMIYSTKTSLRIRSITIQASVLITHCSEYIVSVVLDSRSEDRVYVATSNSWLYLFNLTNGDQINKWNLGLGSLQHVCLCSDQMLEPSESEVVYVVSADTKFEHPSVTRISLSAGTVGARTELYRSRSHIVAVHVTDAGRVVCLITGRNILVLNGESRHVAPRVYQMAHPLTCMDTYLPSSSIETGNKSAAQRSGDIVVGDITGAIYILHNVIKPSKIRTVYTPTKHHWHRMAVCSVKWALDGTYIVSGGLETVLVLWQLETGYKQFLPHMGAAIKNIVVSPLGSTYAVSLSDNSIMTLSTSELSPRTNVAGIQCAAQIRRSERHRAAPCLLHPFIANNLLVATPSNQLDQSASSPYLQTFDTYSDRHISKQALTRTNATIFNQSAEKSAISEPDITFLAATNDGQWLASIDEWQPSKMNALVEEPALNLHAEKKREVYLKFWNWSKLKRKWDLITRVDAPHPSPDEWGVESVLDLIAAPNGHAFVTLGSDGCVKIWRPKMRASTSVCSAACTVNWGHQMSVNFSKKLHYTVFLPLVIADAEQQIQHKRWWGNVAFSEDGSLLAVSCPDPGFSTRDSVLHLIDPASGSICDSLSGLHIGRTNNLAILRHYLIVAGSQKLLVWNLVNSRVEWEYTISELTPTPSPTFHLAVDRKDHTFAIAFSLFSKKQIGAKILVWGLVSDPKPVFTQDLEVPIAALKSAGDGKGFFVLDTHARIQYITPLHATHASVVSIVTSGQQVEIPDAYAFSLLNLMDMNGEAEIDMDITDNELEKVMAREMLAALFDDFEIYGQGSVEAAFEGVMGLYAMTQLGSEVKEDEEEGNGEGEDRSDVEVGDAGKVDSD